MWPYWLLFLIPAYKAVSNLQPQSLKEQAAPSSSWPGWWWVMFIVLVLMVGLRHEVGGDWLSYNGILNLATDVSLREAITQSDPAYMALNWLAAETGLGIYLVNTVCAALFAWGLIAFCRTQPRYWLALTVAMPYMVTMVAMGYSRQGVAIGVVMLGLVALGQGRILRFVLWLALAAAFHKSALVLLPLAALAGTERRIFTLIWLVVAGTLLFMLLLQESVDGLVRNYIEAQMESTGATIRVAMNALPAAVFLLLRRHFHLEPTQKRFWTWMAWGALAFVVLLKVSPSSTAVDRVALYWIPIQLFVWSRLPEALGRSIESKAVLVYVVVGYSATVLLVWLLFSTYVDHWLPYQFYPWSLLGFH
jgi:hypothetical protein